MHGGTPLPDNAAETPDNGFHLVVGAHNHQDRIIAGNRTQNLRPLQAIHRLARNMRASGQRPAPGAVLTPLAKEIMEGTK